MQEFNKLLFEATDETLRQIFGEAATELILTLMERQVLSKMEEMGERIEAFHAYLEKLLGSERAQIIHATSLKRLCLRLRQEYEEVERYFSVLDELYEIKFKLLTSPSGQEGLVCS